MNPTLRKMTLEDASVVAAVQKSLDLYAWSETSWQQSLSENNDAWLLETKSAVVGFVILRVIGEGENLAAELLNIGVSAASQSQGLASFLLEHALSQLSNNVSEVFLEVRQSNIPAIGLYKKLSFLQIGTRKGYYPLAGNNREDALVFKK